MKFFITASVIAAVLGHASAHSWVEEMQVIDSTTGNYTGDYGYPRGYVARTDPGFNGDSMDYLLPALSSGRTRIDNTDLLCHPNQRTSNYANAKYPRLQAAAGSYVAMKYLENGHVTLPQNQPGKPKSGGTVFVYATTKPSNTEKIADVLKWNTAGNGGDSRGTQIAAQNFDDGRCHQINSGTISLQRQKEFPDHVFGQSDSNVEQWCETDVHIPSTYKTGDTVTVYWIWQWPTAAGVGVYPDGKDEYYTSCAEIDIVDSVSNAPPVHTIAQQDAQAEAVSDFNSRAALTTSPLYTLAGASGSAAASTSPSAATTSSTSSSTAPLSVSSSVASSITSTAYTSEFTDLPIISLPTFPFANSSSPTSGSTNNPSNPFPSHASGNPSLPFFSPPAQLPSFVTVTDYITMSDVANKAQGPAFTKTATQIVTNYVTAVASTVVVPQTFAGAGVTQAALPSIVQVPDQAGNAGLIGRRFVA
ncbi:unnamed protein product [Aureobasidium vineae]|uniref:DUF7492 domain-containing protein n=1 Tax=Aureobasidium vineae TaxID=2773715 RepID=A0A9N8JCL6_9PEZI|nr:unnamed protein product [Aureobasidium vineae]